MLMNTKLVKSAKTFYASSSPFILTWHFTPRYTAWKQHLITYEFLETLARSEKRTFDLSSEK